jgi:hypothetical protein
MVVCILKKQFKHFYGQSALKFLVCCDKQIVKGNKLELGIREVAKDLELNAEKVSSAVIVLKNMI